MEKKICPWCGKEMKEDCFENEYFCNCEQNITLNYSSEVDVTELILYDEVVYKLIAMKAEHAKLKAEAERTRWHSVADNDLPTKEQEENKEYLVQTKYGYCIAKLLGEFVTIESGEEFYELYFEDFDDWEDIIAWSELSLPYKNN